MKTIYSLAYLSLIISTGLMYGCKTEPSTTSDAPTSSSSSEGTTETPTTSETTTGTTTGTSSESSETSESESTGTKTCDDPGQTFCLNKCVDLQTNKDHCGECFNACDFMYSCISGQCCSPYENYCENSNSCVDFRSDINNCGECDKVCDAVPIKEDNFCVDSQCIFVCSEQYFGPEGDQCTECKGEVTLNSPLHYWRFTEADGSEAIDAIGGKNGTYKEITLGQPGATAADDKAILFASQDMVQLPMVDIGEMSMPTTEFTIEMIVKPHIVSNPVSGLFSYARENADNYLYVGLEHNNKEPLLRVWIDNWSWVPSASIQTDQWYHIAVTWNNSAQAPNSGLYIYLNGALLSSNSEFALGKVLEIGGHLVFGQDQDSKGGGFDANQAFRGIMDMVAIYDKALTAEEILLHKDRYLCD